MSLKRTTPIPRGKGFKQRTGTIARKLSAPILKPARKAGLKTKQRAVSAEDKALWDCLAALGCVACMKDGHYNPHVSIHHVDGRTKEGCHQRVLALCAPHHQKDDTDPMRRISVHGNKARFEARYGSQAELMAMCNELLKGGRAAAVTDARPVKQSMENDLSENMITESIGQQSVVDQGWMP